jgi:hypothetical protein
VHPEFFIHQLPKRIPIIFLLITHLFNS